MTDENAFEKTTNRRKVLKTIGATGLAATGLAAASGSAAAQQSGNQNPIVYKPGEYSIDDKEAIGSLRVSFDSVNTQNGTASGTVSGRYRGENGVETFEDTFSDAPIAVREVSQGSAFGVGGTASMQGTQTLISLDLGPINLDVLGLIVQTNEIRLRVKCDPAGGLLGNLLCSLLGN
jgi:hypothetical protein